MTASKILSDKRGEGSLLPTRFTVRDKRGDGSLLPTSGDWNEFNRKCTHTHTVDRIWPAGLHQSSRQTSIVCGGSGDIFRDDNKITNHMTGHM